MVRSASRCRRWHARADHQAAGFSLIELLVSIAFLALFGLVVHQCCRALLLGARVLEAASEAQEAARLGVQLIVADAREAGFSPSGPLTDGIQRAGPNVLAIGRDLDGDGDLNDSNERVSYQYAADRHAVLRQLGDAPPQPLLGDLDDDGLTFGYLGADGAPLPFSGGELDAAQRALIRRVTVQLRIAVQHQYGEPVRVAERATAAMRNVE